jgi:hypothetical protein
MNKQELLNKLEAIEREYKGMSHDAKSQEDYIYASGLCEATARIIKLVKGDEDVQPEHSCIENVYQRGKKPHWNVGDTLAYRVFYSDREFERVWGKVTKIEFVDEEKRHDWFYTFADGIGVYEQLLLEEETYKLKD